MYLGCTQQSTNHSLKTSNLYTGDSITDSVNIRFKRMKAAAIKCRLIGLWIDTSYGSVINTKTGYKLAKGKGNKLFIETCNPDSEVQSKNAITMIDALATEVKRMKNRFSDLESDQYYIINNSGDLSIYDNYGLITTCKKVF